MEITNPSVIAGQYKKIIAAFKNRYDVQNGVALGYRPGQDMNADLPFENWPKTIGQAFSTTGYCVSVSQALLYDKVFQTLIQSRGALAKLVSIDIKEQYYGKTYSGNQNIWHTAILVQDSGINFIVDLTCSQFGNNFVNKYVWDFQTWERTFRSPVDKHIILGFDNQPLTYKEIYKWSENYELELLDVVKKLSSITTINDAERNILAKFFVQDVNVLNTKISIGNINKMDFGYFENINKLMRNLDFKEFEKQYYIMEFANKETALDWIKKFMKNDGVNNQFLLTSTSIADATKRINVAFEAINIESLVNTTYIVMEFSNIKTYVTDFLKNINACVPYGIKLYFDSEKDIFNGGKLLEESIPGLTKKTNTIYIKCKN